MTSWLALVLLALAAWRTWVLLGFDLIGDKLRDRFAPVGSGRRQFLECPFCAGFWISGAWVTAWCAWGPDGWPGLVQWQLGWWACSAALVLVDKISDRLGE